MYKHLVKLCLLLIFFGFSIIVLYPRDDLQAIKAYCLGGFFVLVIKNLLDSENS